MSISDKPEEDFVSDKAKSSSSNLPEVEKSTTLDTVHNDEAIKVLANYTGDETWTDEEEKQVLRRIDWKLMPILCVTYGLQYYDKAMFSQAVCPLSCCPPLLWLSLIPNLMPGTLRFTRGFELGNWQSLLILCCHFISRIHGWSISCNDPCTIIPHRAYCFVHHYSLGNFLDLNTGLLQLPDTLRPEIFPRHVRSWN